jgi:putative alpha-1,2-mannosidase
VKFTSKEVNIRIGTSFTSIEGARKNLKSEISHWNFDLVRQSAANQWNMALGKIQVKGSENDKTLFYSALYHAKLTPRVFSDYDGNTLNLLVVKRSKQPKDLPIMKIITFGILTELFTLCIRF